MSISNGTKQNVPKKSAILRDHINYSHFQS